MDPQLQALINSINSLVSEMKKSSDPAAPQSPGARRDTSDIKEEIATKQALLDVEEELVEQNRIQISINERLIELALRSNGTDEDKKKTVKALRKEIDKLNEANKEYAEEQAEANAIADQAVSTLEQFTGVTKNSTKGLIANSVALAGNKKAQKALGKELKETYTAGNIGVSVLSKLSQGAVYFGGKAILEAQSGLANFNKQLGMTQKYGPAIESISARFRGLGVTSDDAGQAIAALSQAFPLSEIEGNTEAIAGQFALFEKFGVAAGDSASAFTTLTRSLGRTSEESLKTLNAVGALGQELGMGPGRLTAEFAQALPRLSIYGKNTEKVFGNIAFASSKLGMSVSDVIDLAEGFQTFEGSAQAAGKLNSILGGGFIDNLELMEASFEDPAKAALMIKDAFTSAGMSVSSMGPAAIKAAASAAGFSDVGKFRSFLEGEISATDALGTDQLDGQLEANELARRSLTIQEEISAKLTEFAMTLAAPFGGIQGVQEMIRGMSPGAMAGIAAGGAVGAPLLTGAGMNLAGSLLTGGSATGAIRGMMAGKGIAGLPRTGAAGKFSKIPADHPMFKKAPKGGMFSKMGKFAKMGGKLAKGAGVLHGITATGKDLYDLAQGDTSAGNTGALVGSVLGGAVGLIGGPAGVAIGAGIGNMIGESIGEYFDSSMPQQEVNKKAAEAGTKSVVEHKHVVEIIQDTNNAERFVKAVYRKDLSTTTAV